jgi:prophage antirepressor-like protein
MIYPGNRIERTYNYTYGNNQFPLRVIFENNEIYFNIRDVFKIIGINREPFEVKKMAKGSQETYLMKFVGRKQRFMKLESLIFFAEKYAKKNKDEAINFSKCIQTYIYPEPFTYTELSNRITILDKKTVRIGCYFN